MSAYVLRERLSIAQGKALAASLRNDARREAEWRAIAANIEAEIARQES